MKRRNKIIIVRKVKQINKTARVKFLQTYLYPWLCWWLGTVSENVVEENEDEFIQKEGSL